MEVKVNLLQIASIYFYTIDFVTKCQALPTLIETGILRARFSLVDRGLLCDFLSIYFQLLSKSSEVRV